MESKNIEVKVIEWFAEVRKPLTVLCFLILCVPIPVLGENYISLKKDLVVTVDQDYIDLPVISIDSEKIESRIGYGIYFESWSSKSYVCRIHLNRNIDKIKKDTVIVLNGKYEIEKTSSGMFAHKFFVKEPKEISYIACGVYVDYYRSLLGEKVRLISRTFPDDFK